MEPVGGGGGAVMAAAASPWRRRPQQHLRPPTSQERPPLPPARRDEDEEEDLVTWFFSSPSHPSETDYTSFHLLGFRQKVRTLVWVHKTRLLGHYKIFHHYIERCPCRPSSPLSRSYARSYSRALTGIGPRPCLRAPLSLLGLQGLFIRTPPSADAWAGLSSGGPAGMGMGLGQGRAGEAGAPNAYLVEIFRLQPFAAAAYLRSLLYCWIGGVMLQLEAAASFGVVADGPGTFYERTAWHWLCLQLTLQFLQAPARLQLWRRLVRVSHSQEAEEASERIRRLVTSHLWIFSQALGTLFHIVAAFGPVFLHLIEPGSPVRRSVLAVCCANLLVFVVRSALTYIIVISILDARNGGGGGPGRKLKRGLSRESLLRLRRVESDGPCADGDSAAAGPGMCSICLAQFEAGESLVLLPCDERHAFHEDCITQWLVKSAQCPLCMGDVAVPKTPQPGPGPAVGAKAGAGGGASSASAGAGVDKRAAPTATAMAVTSAAATTAGGGGAAAVAASTSAAATSS